MSNEAVAYGQLESEKLAADSEVARKIVREIGHFGINDRQRWLIIYNLALELEKVDEMKGLTSYIKDTKGSDIFITRIYGGEEDNG
jgi:hypothetical protein